MLDQEQELVGVLIIDTTNETQASRAQLSIKKLVLPPTWALGLAVLIIAVAVFHLAFLLRYPTVFVDEAWMASRAWAWLHTGVNVGPLDGIEMSRLDGYWTFYPLLPTLLHAATIRLFGMSVASLRLLSLMFGFGLLIAVYLIAYELYRSRRTALITVLLVSISFPFLLSAHLIRPDIFVAALGYMAIALYLVGRRTQRSVFNLSTGLLIGIAFEIHPNAAIYGPIIVALHLVDDGRRFIRQRSFWTFVVGTCLSLAGYVWLHILPYPETYFTLMSGYTPTHTPPVASGKPSAILGNLASMGEYLLRGTATRILATLIAAVILWRKGVATYARPLTMLVVGIVTFALFVRHKGDYYLILIAPLTDIVLGIGIEQMLQWESGTTMLWLKRGQADGFSTIAASLARFLSKALVYSALAVSLVLTFNTVRTAPPPGDLDLIAHRIEQVVPKDGSIMGSHTFWFKLYQHPYLTWQQIRAYQRFNPDSTFDDAMQALHPDVLMIDDHMRLFIVADPSNVRRYFRERSLPKQEFEAFLARRGELEDKFDTAAYGTIEIYSIHWDDADSAAP